MLFRSLGLTHPAVNQVAGQLTRKGLLQSSRDPGDYRRRLLSLTKLGRETVVALQPVWSVIAEATGELAELSGVNLIEALSEAEANLDRESMYDRVTTRLRKKKIVP